MGGIPIDRKSKGNMVDKMIKLYDNWNSLTIMITPEGTRSYSPEWKKGFYHIANGAKIPISLGFLDYKKKEAGIGPLVYPTGDYESDLEVIKSFYRTINAKYPEKGVK
jgi:1-acyl-sn-glycerol-3-phosphate acyltransferase